MEVGEMDSLLLNQTLLETTNEGCTALDMSRFESGMYLVRIEGESGVMVQKVTIIIVSKIPLWGMESI